MHSDFSAIAVLLPQPLLNRLEDLRRSRNLSSMQEALLIVLSDYFANQPESPKAIDSGSRIEARLSRTEALLAALSDRVNRLEGYPPTVRDFDDIEDEPDEVLHSFLEPERSFPQETAGRSPEGKPEHQPEHQPAVSESEETSLAAEDAAEKAIAFGRNLGWTIQPDGKAQPASYEDIEDEPDEILYDFLEPG